MFRWRQVGLRQAVSNAKLPMLYAGAKLRNIGLRDVTIVGALPFFRNKGSMTFGSGVRFSSLVFRCSFLVEPGASLQVGDDTFFNDGCQINCKSSIRIGADCKFAELTCVMDSDQHPVSQDQPTRHAAVVIGNNVWVGRGAMILAGVTLGDHCVVAAGAVVTKSFEARTVIAGVPGRAVGRVTCDDTYKRP